MMPIRQFLRTNRRLLIALGCYLILIVIALIALLPVRNSHERFVLGFVLCFFAILIVKTIVRTIQDRNPE
ncbi:MAG: hypothetical protein JXA73_03705 [Acidobacteria bacterium]|nr:hypothetical protein [Acidobacteriota bacterium]